MLWQKESGLVHIRRAEGGKFQIVGTTTNGRQMKSESKKRLKFHNLRE